MYLFITQRGSISNMWRFHRLASGAGQILLHEKAKIQAKKLVCIFFTQVFIFLTGYDRQQHRLIVQSARFECLFDVVNGSQSYGV